METQSDKTREQRLRRLGKKQGYYLRKSRVKNPYLDDQGGYMVIEPYWNIAVYGERFDLTLDDVERFFSD